MHFMPVLGPTLNCVGFTASSANGECNCIFNGQLQYGVCMELTVEVGNASTDLNCRWCVRMNGMYVEQVKNDPGDFFVVKGDKSQVRSFICACTHIYIRMYALHTHTYSCLWTQEYTCMCTHTHTHCIHTHQQHYTQTHITHMPHTHTWHMHVH